jgi:drug/metabolite transporter (DMT)-like permease
MADHPLRGAVLALVAAVLFGASTPAAKVLLGDASPWLVAGLLSLASGIVLTLFALARAARGAARAEAPLERRDLPRLALVVLCGGAIGPALLMAGLAVSPAASTALLLNLESVLTLAIAWTVFRENVDGRIFLGATAIVAGAVVLSWRGTGADWGIDWGAVAVAGACLAWAIDNNLTRTLAGSDPVQIAAVKGVAAGLANVAIAGALGAAWPPAASLPAIATVGVLGYGVSLVLFILALRHVGAARTGAYFAAAPFVGAVLAVAALGEPVTWPLLAAGALMAFGVWLHLTERHEHDHVHEPLVHAHRHAHDTHHQHAHEAGDPQGEPHSHVHAHGRVAHRHPHFPDLHHDHVH